MNGRRATFAYIRGSRAVVVGTGDVGSHIARSSRALGAEVHGVSRSGRGDSAVFASLSPVSELPTLATTADWLIITVPLTSETRGLIGRDVMSACRGAVLINAGRGAVVDEAMIPEALDNGWLAGAILDVFEVGAAAGELAAVGRPARDDLAAHLGATTADGAIAGFLECSRGDRERETTDENGRQRASVLTSEDIRL